VGVAYFILPSASGFLYGFQTKDIELMLTADAYFGFVTVLFIAFGGDGFPIVLSCYPMGIVSSKRLRISRRDGRPWIVIFSDA